MSACLARVSVCTHQTDAAATASHCVDFLQALHAMLLSQVSSGCAGPGPTPAASPQQCSGSKQRSSTSGSATWTRQWSKFQKVQLQQQQQQQEPAKVAGAETTPAAGDCPASCPSCVCIRHSLDGHCEAQKNPACKSVLFLYPALFYPLKPALILSRTFFLYPAWYSAFFLVMAARRRPSCDCVECHVLAFNMSLPNDVSSMR